MFKKLKLMYKYRSQILFLAYEQIKKQYLETAFGILWAVVKPLVFVLSFWFFFTIGLRKGVSPDGTSPYVLYIFAGYMPWFVMSELITSGSNVIRNNAVLVKTIRFPVTSLPLINVISRMIVHIIVMGLVMIFFMFYGKEYFPSIHYINFIYYWFTMIAFFTSFTLLISALATVVRDISPLIIALIQPLFWVTPVLYTPSSQKFEHIMRFVDPLYYFINGYRETMLGVNGQRVFFFTEIWYDIYIWVIIIIMYLIGARVFNKIRPYMADLV